MTDVEYLKKYMDSSQLQEGLNKLNKGIPVQYIVGNVDFCGLNFEIDKNVLIPRFETEELVDRTIKNIQQFFNKEISILDIGTGSGCIAITLKKGLENCDVDATDISLAALEVAKKNAVKNQAHIKFYQGNLYENITKKYDVIISNPPYISYDEEIMSIVKEHEPHIALYAENDGLYFYEEIIKNSCNYLNEKFMIAFEIGESQGLKIKKIIDKYIDNCKIIIEKDLQNRDRFIFIFK